MVPSREQVVSNDLTYPRILFRVGNSKTKTWMLKDLWLDIGGVSEGRSFSFAFCLWVVWLPLLDCIFGSFVYLLLFFSFGSLITLVAWLAWIFWLGKKIALGRLVIWWFDSFLSLFGRLWSRSRLFGHLFISFIPFMRSPKMFFRCRKFLSYATLRAVEEYFEQGTKICHNKNTVWTFGFLNIEVLKKLGRWGKIGHTGKTMENSNRLKY